MYVWFRCVCFDLSLCLFSADGLFGGFYLCLLCGCWVCDLILLFGFAFALCGWHVDCVFCGALNLVCCCCFVTYLLGRVVLRLCCGVVCVVYNSFEFVSFVGLMIVFTAFSLLFCMLILADCLIGVLLLG